MQYEIVISGGGLVGSALAVSLKKAGFNCCIVEKNSKSQDFREDCRTTAVTYGSHLWLNSIGIWEEFTSDVCPIYHIKVFEQGTAQVINYKSSDVTPYHVSPMGFIVENFLLRRSFIKAAENAVDIYFEDEIKSLIQSDSYITVETSKGSKIKASLVIACEGMHSPLRDSLGISVKRRTYGQSAIITSIEHEEPHMHHAWEIFTPDGPVALLPLNSANKNLNRSGLVWSVKTPKAAELLKSTEPEFLNSLQQVFPYYGKLLNCTTRKSYPLSMQVTEKTLSKRCLIIGDAAHHYHPVAGQGVNLGWKDAQALTDVLKEAKYSGQDLGSNPVLDEFAQKTAKDIKQLGLVTDGIVRLFQRQSTSVYFLRQIGFYTIERLPWLKRSLVRRAMGIT